jgi:hypothetical protein
MIISQNLKERKKERKTLKLKNIEAMNREN